MLHVIACHSWPGLNLVSEIIKTSTYCATDIDSISNLLWMEFIFKWPIIERPGLPISERQDALGMSLYIRQYIWIFYLNSLVKFHSILFLFFLYRFNFVQKQLLKWNICRCWFYSLELPTIRKPAESKWNIVRIRAQYYLVIVMGIICIENHFAKLWSTKFMQQNFLLTSYSFTKVWIPQSYFYLIIRFLSLHQNSYLEKLQVTLNFSDKLHIRNTNNIVKSPTLLLKNLKIQYKYVLLPYKVRKY